MATTWLLCQQLHMPVLLTAAIYAGPAFRTTAFCTHKLAKPAAAAAAAPAVCADSSCLKKHKTMLQARSSPKDALTAAYANKQLRAISVSCRCTATRHTCCLCCQHLLLPPYLPPSPTHPVCPHSFPAAAAAPPHPTFTPPCPTLLLHMQLPEQTNHCHCDRPSTALLPLAAPCVLHQTTALQK
jgi:hypothetical protein